MGRPDYIVCQFREIARCRDAQHGDGVCCAFAPKLVFPSVIIYSTVMTDGLAEIALHECFF